MYNISKPFIFIFILAYLSSTSHFYDSLQTFTDGSLEFEDVDFTDDDTSFAVGGKVGQGYLGAQVNDTNIYEFTKIFDNSTLEKI